MHSMQLISLDAIIMLIAGMEIRCKGCKELCKPSRHEASSNLPTREELLAIKANKRVSTYPLPFHSSRPSEFPLLLAVAGVGYGEVQ